MSEPRLPPLQSPLSPSEPPLGNQGSPKQKGVLQKIFSAIGSAFSFKKDAKQEIKTPKKPIPNPVEKEKDGVDKKSWFQKIFSTAKKSPPVEVQPPVAEVQSPVVEVIEKPPAKQWTDEMCLKPINTLIDHLSKPEFLKKEGVLRISGDSEEVKKGMNAISDGTIDSINLNEIEDINTVTGILKGVWNKVPFDPIVGQKAVLMGSLIQKKEMKIPDLSTLKEDLTPAQAEILDKIILYSVEIAKESEKNLMGSSNIAKLLAPMLSDPNENPVVVSFGRIPQLTAFFEAIISHNMNNPDNLLKFS